jgi:hypothetical protein
MAHGRISILRAIPGSTALKPILNRFCAPGYGIVTAFSDAVLPSCKTEVDEDTLIEVLPFGELVRRFLEMCGDEALRIAPQSHTLAAIAEACRDLPEESPFRRTARFPGLHEAIQKTLSELSQWGLIADELDRLADLAEGRLAAKLRSLAAIDRESHRLLNLLGLESHARQILACLETTPERDGSFERLFCFVGSEEAPLKLRWLQWAAKNGTDVTVVLDRHATDGRVFQGAARALELLDGKVEQPGEANRLLNNLFAEGEHEGPAIEVVVASAPDPLAECEWAMREVVQNDSPERCAVFVRNLEGYAPLIEASAKRLGVPIRMNRRAPLLTNSLARLTLVALEFVCSNDVRTIGPVLQSSYLGLTGEEQAIVHSGLKECHRTRELQWLTLRTWTEAHEDRFGWILNLLAWRHENLGAARTLSEWHQRLQELIDKVLPVLQRTEIATEYSQERDRRARNQMLRLLAGEASVAKATEQGTISLPEMVALCRRLWQNSDASVPTEPFGACVTGNPDCLEDADTVVVLGMLEGVFPRRRTEDPILTDEERAAISAMRPSEPRLRTSRDIADEERDAFYRVCSRARNKLVLSYPQAYDTRDNVPAFYLELVQQALGKVQTVDRPRSQVAPNLDLCVTAADSSLRQAIDGPRELPLPLDVSSDEARAELKKEDQPVTPSELRDAQTCPFMYLARHRLKLKPKRTTARWASLRQLPQAATLARHSTPREAEGALLAALDSHLDSLYSEIPEWEMQLLRAGGKRLIAEWVRREFAARKIWPRKEESLLLNVGFGTHGTRDKLWNGVTLEGIVPAKSQIDDINVAHLYSGSAREADRLTEVDRMYLGIHLAALHEQGKESAVEMESMVGKRTLYTLTRAGARPLTSEVQSGLQVVELAVTDDEVSAKKVFYDEVKRLVSQAAAHIRNGDVDAIPGDRCDWCDYGELCRRSRGFGEEDSPFGADEETVDR